MPFVSQAQMRWMYTNHPKMAAEWADKTSNRSMLPERKHPKSYSMKEISMAMKMRGGK